LQLFEYRKSIFGNEYIKEDEEISVGNGEDEPFRSSKEDGVEPLTPQFLM
jgi:hypothetical protein